MKIKRGYKFRLYPTYKQREMINKTIGCSRFVYNWALATKKEAYEKDKTNLSFKEISNMIVGLKKEHPFLNEVGCASLYAQLNHLNNAYSSFFKGSSGFPKFRKKDGGGSCTAQVFNTAINVKEGYVTVPRCGKVKCVFHRNIEGAIQNRPYIKVSRTPTGEYYVSFVTELNVDVPKKKKNPDNTNTIGIDVGVKDLAVLDDGTKFGHLEVDEKIERRKKRLQRKLSKKVGSKKGQKKSNNFIKLRTKIAKLDQKIARRRDHYQYNVVSEIMSRDFQYVGMENLNVKGMSATGKSRKKLSSEEYAALSPEEKKKYNRKKKKGFNRSIMRSGLYSFKMKIENKAESKGRKVVTVGRFYASSQICSNCGEKNDNVKNLNVRKWTCKKCGAVHDRDVNAAINIKNEAIRLKGKSEEALKPLPKCDRDVKSAEIDRIEKPNVVGVDSQVCEPEIQTIFIGQTIQDDVITTNAVDSP